MTYDPDYIAEQHEFGGCRAKIEGLQAEVDRMKPVVEAAREWARNFNPDPKTMVTRALVRAVDAYEDSAEVK